MLGTIDSVDIERIEVAALLDTDKSQIPKTIKMADKKGAHGADKKADHHEEEPLPPSPTIRHKHSESSRSLLIYLVTSSRTYKLSASNSNSFVEWLQNLDRYLYGEVILESFLDKKGSDHKAFKQRYFAVNQYRQIKYYNNERRETLHGVIDLNDDTLSVQYSMNEHLIEIRSEKRKWILFAKEATLYRKWVSTLRSLMESQSTTPSGSTIVALKGNPNASNLSSPDVLDPALWTTPSEVTIDRKSGDIFREWIKAQNEMKLGDQPTVCLLYGVRLKQMGKVRRKGTTVADLQTFLKGAGVGKRRKFGADSADYTDNEWSDDEDEDEEEDENENELDE